MDNYKIKFDLTEKVKKYDEYILSKNSNCKNDLDIKTYLIKNQLKNDICEICKMSAIWNKKPINLILERKNKNAKDNRLDNLRIICPNCYSQVKKRPTLYVKNKNETFTTCCQCNKKIRYSLKGKNNNKYQTFRCKSCLNEAVCSINLSEE